MSVTTPKELETWLTAHELPFSSITELTGGTANFVFRVESGGEKDSYVVKHAEPYVRSSHGIPFPVERMDFEARALSNIAAHLPEDDTVNPAKLIEYDTQDHVLVMSDGGPTNLKEAYTDPNLNIEHLGVRIGRWLANLHAKTKQADIGDNVIAKSIYRWSYAHLEESFESFGFDPNLGVKVNEKFGSLLATDNDNICHGDFWPGNVLVGSDQKLTIVDWEMSRRGLGATDVGQFAAEAWLLDTFQGGRGLLTAFLSGYVDASGSKPSREFATRCIVHWATHIAYWPTRVEWTDKQGTKELVDLGRRTLLQVFDEDWHSLSQGGLGPLVHQ